MTGLAGSIRRGGRRVAMAALLPAIAMLTFVAAPNASGVVGDQLVVNGSFEQGYPGNGICGGGWYGVGYGPAHCTATIPGWTVGGAGVDWQGPADPSPPAIDGVFTVDLIGGGAGSLHQTIATTPGASYTLTFAYAAHTWCTANQFNGVPTAKAQAGSSELAVSATLAEGWKSGSLAFTATSSTTAIALIGTHQGSCGGIVVDNVSVLDTVVPDSDGDGFRDDVDNCVDTPNADQADNDGDGAGDSCDDDDDGNGIVDTPAPTSADQCKKGGWASFDNPAFRNQGQCVSSVQRNRP